MRNIIDELCRAMILYLHRALNKVTQSANQHMHTFLFLIY